MSAVVVGFLIYSVGGYAIETRFGIHKTSFSANTRSEADLHSLESHLIALILNVLLNLEVQELISLSKFDPTSSLL